LGAIVCTDGLATSRRGSRGNVAGAAAAASGGFAWELRNMGNRNYILDIEVGGHPITVLPDTGSFSLMVTSSRCPKSKCDFPKGFDPNASKTYSEVDTVHAQQFGSGTVLLGAAKDRVRMPGFGEPRELLFWEITEADERMGMLWQHADFEAVLGLSWRSNAPVLSTETEETAVREPTVLEVFDAPAFTVCLGRIELLPNKPAQKTPSYMYWAAGGASAALLATRRAPELSTPWTYLEVNGDSHWSVKLAGVELKHITEDKPWKLACHDSPCAALIDIGASTITAPMAVYGTWATSAGKVQKDCSNFELLPDLLVSLMDRHGEPLHLKIPPSAWVAKFAFTNRTSGAVTHSCSSRVYPGAATNSQGEPMWILGTPFFQSYVVDFDRTSSPARIGFAKHPGVCPAPAAGTLARLAPARSAAAISKAVEVHSSDDLLAAEEGTPIDAVTLAGLGLLEPAAAKPQAS